MLKHQGIYYDDPGQEVSVTIVYQGLGKKRKNRRSKRRVKGKKNGLTKRK
jgi:hypothetical protein